ncbi:Radical SAM domain protein [Pirellula staleyi DSM 6068]|uniref:Radical SAM domain protein n=1 Tax=Pirellula staleyi (strain ATCC 27377 / DSM 6068 / ICPB 4128) TaxID=530564 RepID=D2R2Y4_PIRSD|nr:radical SAM protein [Pirellula staleyi]ADB18717.1 Radical SAM domain protein [Pirellula staleyi DSM 6068]
MIDSPELAASPGVPEVPLSHLDQLWFQVSGLLCNLACHHCFVSSSPTNRSLEMLSFDQIKTRLEESIPLGVKEYYFTGGEPFLHPQMTEILELSLQYGPTTVLTNGTVLKDSWLARLAAVQAASIYSLEFRLSIDGPSAAINDPVRGSGTFARAMAGVKKLCAHGFLPLITAVRTWNEEDESQILSEFVEVLREQGYARPRLKILPSLRLGEEARRSGAYAHDERVTAELLIDFDRSQLLCEHARHVSVRGVHVCPLLVEQPTSILGDSLAESLQKPARLDHGACFTCYQFGAICSNSASRSMRGEEHA